MEEKVFVDGIEQITLALKHYKDVHSVFEVKLGAIYGETDELLDKVKTTLCEFYMIQLIRSTRTKSQKRQKIGPIKSRAKSINGGWGTVLAQLQTAAVTISKEREPW